MGGIINLESKLLQKTIKYKSKICPILDGNQIYEAVVIALEDLNTGKVIEVCDYSKFFLINPLLNRDKNTRLGYAKVITMFLNYTFFDRMVASNWSRIKNLDKIENLTIDDGNRFLNDYKVGKIGNKGVKKRESIEIAERKLTNFYYFLYKSYNMKFIKQNNFQYVTRNINYNGRLREIKTLKSIFTIHYLDQCGRKRLHNLSFYALVEFIFLALEYYPMIALAIAIQACAGLRKGEVCNVSYYNSRSTYIGDELKDWCVDLGVKPQLRSDGVDVGQIKSPGIAHVHPSLLPFFDLILREHEKYIKQILKKKNKFGAIFINRDGSAMTEKNYERAFNILAEKLIERLYKTDDARVKEEADSMLEYNFTTHTLRYFFTNYISKLKDITIFDIAMYRRDRSLSSAMIYIRNNPYLIDDKIKAYQDEIMKT